MKRCSHCGDEKPLESFSPDKKNKDGHYSWCRACCSERQRKRSEAKRNGTVNLRHSRDPSKSTKVCPSCRIERHKSDYHRSNQTWDSLYSTCKYCKRERTRTRRKERQESDPDFGYKQHLKYTFGLSWEEYQAMLVSQDFRCASCTLRFDDETGRKRDMETRMTRPFVDHDHETGAIRGLLCSRCNTALGMLNDEPIKIQQLLLYLTKF